MVFGASMSLRSSAPRPTRTEPDGWNDTTDGMSRSPVRVGDRSGNAVLDGGDDGVGGAEIDADRERHRYHVTRCDPDRLRSGWIAFPSVPTERSV